MRRNSMSHRAIVAENFDGVAVMCYTEFGRVRLVCMEEVKMKTPPVYQRRWYRHSALFIQRETR